MEKECKKASYSREGDSKCVCVFVHAPVRKSSSLSVAHRPNKCGIRMYVHVYAQCVRTCTSIQARDPLWFQCNARKTS